MNNITFEHEADTNHKKENIEWLRIWCEDVNDNTLPHVALIGDSITEGYYHLVKSALKDIAKVDYLATSYSIASDMYSDTVKNFVKDSKYQVVHFNYGLHAFAVDGETYEIRCKDLLEFVASRTKVVVGTTTTVLDDTLHDENRQWKDKVIERNQKLHKIADELHLAIDDLNGVCKTFTLSDRNPDGVHFNESGYTSFAESVVQSIKKQLERR